MKTIFTKCYRTILGIVIGAIISGIGVYAATTIASSNVSYNNSISELKATNVKGALDELYEKMNKKPCKVVSGTGKSTGNEIQCGTEQFYIISYSSTTTKMFSKYSIESGAIINSSGSMQTLSNASGIQNSECGSNSKTFKGLSIKGACYTSHNSSFSRYKQYLSLFGLSKNVDVGYITMQELNQLGCSLATPNGYPSGNCNSSQYSFLKNDSYWLSGSGGTNGICSYYLSSGEFDCQTGGYSHDRVVVSIPTTYISSGS